MADCAVHYIFIVLTTKVSDMNNPVLIPYQQAMKFYLPISFSKIAKRFNYWKSYRSTVNELTRLSDHQLEDIGLIRADIANVAGKVATNVYNR